MVELPVAERLRLALAGDQRDAQLGRDQRERDRRVPQAHGDGDLGLVLGGGALELGELTREVRDPAGGGPRAARDQLDVRAEVAQGAGQRRRGLGLDFSARVAVGLDRLCEDFELDGLTYYYRGLNGNEAERLGAGVIVGNSLLTARGIPTSGEGDLKTNVAQLILDRLGAGGSYTEYYALDFDEDFILMGHDGPGHIAIAEGRPTLRALKLYHGKRGFGLSVEFKVRYGPVTILGCTQTEDGRLKLIAAEGESIPGPTFKIGNTNSRLRFGLEPAPFFDAWCAEGPTHHVALGVGHRIEEIRRIARLMDIELAVVGGSEGGR